MEPKARHIIIGVFTVGITTLAVLFGLWLTRLNAYQSTNQYIVEFNESVSGLSRGSSVLFSGMSVGEVKDLRLDPANPSKVYATITVDKKVPLYQGVEARLQLMGITGQSVISLKGGDLSKPRLIPEDGSQDDDHLPVIVATPSPLSALLDEGKNMMTSLTESIASFSKLFSEENTTNIGKILANVEAVTGVFSSEDTLIRDTLKGTHNLVENFNQTMASVDKLVSNANQLLTEEGKKALDQAGQAMNSITRSAQQINKMLTENENTFNRGMQGFKELTPAIVEFKAAFGTLQNILRNMEDNPASYFINGNEMKEFNP